MNKKGLSPVIASVLLVALVLVLAAIIYLWARAFIPETVEKFGETIENSCPNVAFSATYSTTGGLRVQNNGNVPIYGVQYGVEREGSLNYEDLIQTPIATGGFKVYNPTIEASSKDTIRVIPILLGKSSDGELKAFSCGEDSAEIIQVD